MGRPDHVPNFLYETPSAEDMLFLNDDYMRRSIASTPDRSVQALLFPIWRIRSEYSDTIVPIQQNISELQTYNPSILESKSGSEPSKDLHPGMALLIMEAAQSIRVYTSYLARLRSLKARTEYIFFSYALHCSDMLRAFKMERDVDEVYSGDYSSRLVGSMEMCTLLRAALYDSIGTGVDVLEGAAKNLKELTHYHFAMQVPLPRQEGLRLAYAFMKPYWDKLAERKSEKARCDRLGLVFKRSRRSKGRIRY